MISTLLRAIGLRKAEIAERREDRFEISEEEFERRAARARTRVHKMPRGTPLDPEIPEIIGR
jgi:hypothetical protein